MIVASLVKNAFSLRKSTTEQPSSTASSSAECSSPTPRDITSRTDDQGQADQASQSPQQTADKNGADIDQVRAEADSVEARAGQSQTSPLSMALGGLRTCAAPAPADECLGSDAIATRAHAEGEDGEYSGKSACSGPPSEGEDSASGTKSSCDSDEDEVNASEDGSRSSSCDSSEGDDDVDSSPLQVPVRRRRRLLVSSDSEGELEEARPSSSDLDSSEDESTRPLQPNTPGRVVRQAAVAARQMIRSTDWCQWGSARRRRHRNHEESKSEESDPGDMNFTEELLERLLDRKSIDGVIHYRAEWSEFSGDERFSWEPAENLVGHEDWMELVDLWKTKYESKMRFMAFVKNNRRGYRIGAGEEMKCFFHAVEMVCELLQLTSFDLDRVIDRLEIKGWNFQGGVKKDSLQQLMEALSNSGLCIDHQVWRQNLHKTEMGTGHESIEKALTAGVGVYMVATQDPRRIGHCWVLSVDDDEMLTAYDNGSEVMFSEIRFRDVLWIRRCIPFIRRPRKRKNKIKGGKGKRRKQHQVRCTS